MALSSTKLGAHCRKFLSKACRYHMHTVFKDNLILTYRINSGILNLFARDGAPALHKHWPIGNIHIKKVNFSVHCLYLTLIADDDMCVVHAALLGTNLLRDDIEIKFSVHC